MGQASTAGVPAGARHPRPNPAYSATTARDASPAPRPRPRRRRRPTHHRFAGVMLVLPAVAVFLGFMAVPAVIVLATSLTKWSGYDLAQLRWIGLGNYRGLAHDPVFWKAWGNTLLFTILTTLLLNFVGLGLALLIATRVRFAGVLKVVLFMPVLMSPVIVGLMWSSLLRGAGGAVNQVLQAVHLTQQPIFFLGDPHWALAAIVLATVWQFAGYDMILYHAGLQAVPRDLIEAATLEGAGKAQMVRHIVLPTLYPVISVVVLLNVIGGLRIFDTVYIMTNGGPNHGTEVLATYMYQKGFGESLMGTASAIAVVIVGCAVIVSVVRLRVNRHVG